MAATATPDPIEGWRAALATLGSQLVDLESDSTVALARTGGLSGDSRAQWDQADAGVALAWETYRAVDELVNEAGATPARISERLSSSVVPAPGGETDPTSAMRAAKAAVEAAVALALRLSTTWNDLAKRVSTARTAATEAGDTATTKSAQALAELIANDPLAVTEADIAAVETAAASAASRRSADQAAAVRFDVNLTQARATLASLRTDLEAARDELEHAASRIAGLAKTDPVPDLDALAGWLDRIATAATGNKARAAADLDDWVEATAARRAELEAALAPARSGMKRREDGRGLWTARRAQASARRLDEDPEVAAALKAARQELWQAPCDLDVAEAGLAKLGKLLESRPGDVTS